MVPYLLKRVLLMIPTMLGITLITFIVISMAPGDPIAAQSGGGAIEGGGGGANSDRTALVIKAKKQLLGILAKDPTVRVWDGSRSISGAPETTLELTGRVGELTDWPHAIVLAPDGVLYAGTEAGRVVAISPASDVAVRQFGTHPKAVWAIALSPDGARLATGDTDGNVSIWDTRDGRRIASVPFGKTVRALTFVLGGARLAVGTEDGLLRELDAASGEAVHESHDHTGFVGALAASPDGAVLYSGGFDRKLRAWDASDLHVLRVVDVHGQAITGIALSSDGRRMATSCDDRLVRIIDLAPEGRNVELRGHVKEATAVAISADGNTVWSGSKDELILGWDAGTGKVFARTGEANGRIYSLALSADGSRVYSASESWVKNPAWKRYVKWLGKTVTFDFGNSFTDERRVMDKIVEALPVTLGMNLISIVIIYLVAIPLGVIAAVRRGSTFDFLSSIVLFMLSSAPAFWIGTLLITTFSSERAWNILPSVHLHSMESESLSYLPWLADWGKHLVLPLVVLIYGGFAGLSRYVRTSMLETIAQDYVRTARAKGLSERLVNYKHALRNSMITIVTLVGTLLPGMIGGSIIVEQIFSIQGMGFLGFQAVTERDYPVIMAITTFSALLTLFGMLLSDILYTVVDPRISHA